ncbi:MAG: SDR family oxidoreductase [Myxococcales bacterium]|nr:SDR family oxidoreductase [Myxococcales bacterium]MCB9626981.1 SDR family oxidoreductase [Sandaracinaceae bacterium]
MTQAHPRVFVTGGTGLIGRFAIEALLRRGAQVTMVVRASSMAARAERLDALRAMCDAATNGATLSVVDGDLGSPGLGLGADGHAALAAADHVFHLAALYDINADEAALVAANEAGTRHLLDALRKGFAGVLHHVSSIAVAGNYQGTFTESMFDEKQSFPHAYHRSKFNAERQVREAGVTHRIYRPSAVVGHSQTGEMDRVDGPYLGFAGLQQLAATVPRWVKLPTPKVRGRMNLVPVDFVAEALVHIGLAADARDTAANGRVYHLVDPSPPPFMRMNALFLRELHGPGLGMQIDVRGIPGVDNALNLANMLPSVGALRRDVLDDLGLPATGIDALNLRVRFDDLNTQAALSGSGIACPPLEDYVRPMVRYYEDHLSYVHQRPLRYAQALRGKVVLVTGASRGIGAEVARQAARAGAELLLVARGAEALEQLATELRADGAKVTTYPTDLSDFAALDALAATVTQAHGGVDVLVHNAAHSIRRSIAESRDRFHDYERTMQLNYFAPVRLTMGLLPGLRERGGAVCHVLTMGVLIPGPYFSAYLASKSALEAFGNCLAAECHHEGVHVSNIYLPLVRTEMMAPTKEYADRKDIMTPERAAHMVLDGVVDKRRLVMTGQGRFYSISNRISPKTSTRILNLLHRVFPEHGAPTSFPVEKALLTKLLGGSPI